MRELLLVMSVAGRLYALPTRAVREIVFEPAVSTVPGQPRILHGFFNWRGTTVAVISLRSLFGESIESLDLYAPVVVLQGFDDHRTLALLADKVLDVVEPDAASFRTPNAVSVNDCTESVFYTAAGDVTVLSVDRLLLVQEQQRIAELGEKIEARLLECQGVEP